jgi:xanthine dehydrogenase YagT iron-sulfur-binding subunit
MSHSDEDLTRRDFVAIPIAAAALTGTAGAQSPPATLPCSLTINGHVHDLQLEPRVTLLDLLRERLQMVGTKKGCDHGQCGACTVISDGVRINSCLTLAITQDQKKITTIEGLASGADLHPMQAAFIEYDGFQCGFCTSGQICSAVAMLREPRTGRSAAPLSVAEIKEKMAGNICRCGAYAGIVAAIQSVEKSGTAA